MLFLSPQSLSSSAPLRCQLHTASFPRKRRAVRGMSRCVAGARQAPGPFCGYFLVVETQKVERGVRYQNTVLGDLLKVVSRRHVAAIVSRHEGDKYIKDFSSWDHLVT